MIEKDYLRISRTFRVESIVEGTLRKVMEVRVTYNKSVTNIVTGILHC